MLRTQQHQVVEAGLAAGTPVLNMVRINKTLVMATGEGTSFVPRLEARLMAVGTVRYSCSGHNGSAAIAHNSQGHTSTSRQVHRTAGSASVINHKTTINQ
jgi:hypothetical protein